jgi:hypothetical protein
MIHLSDVIVKELISWTESLKDFSCFDHIANTMGKLLSRNRGSGTSFRAGKKGTEKIGKGRNERERSYIIFQFNPCLRLSVS